MSFLEPAIRLVGTLSFRNKLRATAIVFGVPLLVALGLILNEINTRVSALQLEREALEVQVPALALSANLHQYIAASQAWREGVEELGELVQTKQDSTLQAFKVLDSSIAERKLLAGKLTASEAWVTAWNKDFEQVKTADADALTELHAQLSATLRGEVDKLNESSGLLVDGDTSSSRLIDVLTTHAPELIDTTGNGARLGALVLVKKGLKSSRRTELTVLRGNFNALVQWSMDSLRKVTREHPELAPALDDAGSRLNTAYLAIQEAMTVKMLDTSDFDMTPAAYLQLTQTALDESLLISAVVLKEAEVLLAARLDVLVAQRNAVVLVMLLILAVVLAGFIAAYISIMRGLNGLSDAVNTMAAGNLEARVKITSSDEIGTVGKQFNLMVESLAQRTQQLHEKTNDIHAMLQNMPQGILTIVGGGTVHPEYSAYLEKILESTDLAGQPAMALVFENAGVGADEYSQIEAAIVACIGEDLMNFEFNAHLLVGEINKTMPDGRVKCLDLSWSPICDERDEVEKIMLCVRDVTELRQLEAEAEHQKRELEMIGQILKVNQEKFSEFVISARKFVADNAALLNAADDKNAELVTQLFRNMHTIKGNARTYGLLHLTNIVHEAEQAYDELRKNSGASFDKVSLLSQLELVRQGIEEYATLNEVKLGRKGPGRRGSAEKYVMIEREQVETMLASLERINPMEAHPIVLMSALQQIKLNLRLIGTERIQTILDGVFDSLPSLAKELNKEPPQLQVNDNGIQIRNQVSDLLRNVFMHLYRNAMDHGIETAAERLLRGKSATGTIQLDLALHDERLEMRLKDDGKGLALGYIRSKAIERGLIADGADVPDEALAKLIFAAGFSTAKAVTEVSGRGVGMDAVQDFVKREGGEIRLELTDQQTGAAFRTFETIISFPGKFAVNTLQHEKIQVTEAVRAKPAEHHAASDLLSIARDFLMPGKLAKI